MIYIIAILEILYGIYNIVKMCIFFHKISHKKVNNTPNKGKVIIVIPCLYEQSIIIDTINYFLNLISNFPNIEFAIVTTEKEKKIDNIQTTKEVINDYIRINNIKQIKHYHYPKSDGIMADQLNYVLSFYDKDVYSYFSVYNADSRPNINTIKELINTIKYNNYPYIIQQYSYAFSNLDKLSFIMKGFALYQSNFEIKYGLLNSSNSSKFLYTYVVGHGLYIRLDLLKEMNGFNNKFWCEDIYLSSNLRCKNINIIPLLVLENMETPKKLSILIRQNATWFKTANQVFKIFKSNYKDEKKITISLLFWLLNRIWMNLSWLFLPFMVIIPIITSIYLKDLSLFITLICSYMFMEICIFLSTLIIIEKLEHKKLSKKIILFGMISTLISNFGPIYSIFNFKMKKYKTER